MADRGTGVPGGYFRRVSVRSMPAEPGGHHVPRLRSGHFVLPRLRARVVGGSTTAPGAHGHTTVGCSEALVVDIARDLTTSWLTPIERSHDRGSRCRHKPGNASRRSANPRDRWWSRGTIGMRDTRESPRQMSRVPEVASQSSNRTDTARVISHPNSGCGDASMRDGPLRARTHESVVLL